MNAARRAPDPELTVSCELVQDLLPGAALDALQPAERLLVEQHAAHCEACAAELASFREAAGALVHGMPQVEPPASLRQRVLDAAAATPQDVPPPISLARWRSLRRVAPVWGAVVAALVVSAGSLAWAASLQTQVGELSGKAARYDRVVAVLASQQLATRSLQPVSATTGGHGTIYLDPASGGGMVMVHDLPVPPAGRVYQLWFTHGERRTSGGVLRLDATGSGYTIIACPKDLDSYESIGITEEPAGGSPAPTTPRLMGTTL